MSKHGKKYRAIAKAAPKDLVSVEEAVKFIKAHPGSKKFDETLDVYMHLGVDIRKTDTPVRGTVKLPAGSGKKVTVVDERYFKQAENQLYEELAYALNMNKNEIGDYINKSMKANKKQAG